MGHLVTCSAPPSRRGLLIVDTVGMLQTQSANILEGARGSLPNKNSPLTSFARAHGHGVMYFVDTVCPK